MGDKKYIIVGGILLLAIFVFFFFLFSKPESNVTDLNAEEFAQLISDDSVFVVDVHIPEQEHILGTDVLIPFNDIESNINKLPSDKDSTIAIYCRSGSMSAEAAKTLQELGYTNIYNLEGGTNEWREAGLEFGPIE
jgi:rhodanese-related sulfurtransferase